MLQRFNSKKNNILNKLVRPASEYTDASPKGSVDTGIRELVDVINASPTTVTTSSCAGRIAVYVDGVAKPFQQAGRASSSASGGKGGGRWIFTSHDPVDTQGFHMDGSLLKHIGLASTTQISCPTTGSSLPLVHFKFEPMILHILCASAQSAQDVMAAAISAGFRESGISSLYDTSGRGTTPMVAVRSTGLSFDSIIAYEEEEGNIVPMVSEGHIRTLIELANDRFEKNELRKMKFKAALPHYDGAQGSEAENGKGRSDTGNSR